MRGDGVVQTQLHMAQAINALADTINSATGYTLTEVPFAQLPAAPTVGMISCVSDCNTNAWGAVAAAGGANKVLVFYNGTGWSVIGK